MDDHNTVTLTYAEGTLTAQDPFILANEWTALSIRSTDKKKFALSQSTLMRSLEHAATIHPKQFDGCVTWVPVTITVLVTESDGDVIYEFQLTELTQKPQLAPEDEKRLVKKGGRRKIVGVPT
jgi:hypothetical protein